MPARLRGTDDGGVQVALSAEEHELLRSLPDQLRPILAGERDPEGVAARLFPRAYDDEEAEADYRELVGADLAEERLSALEAFAETLDGGDRRRGNWHAELDREQAEAWLSATNDARLVLATIVGITSEDQWERRLARGDPAGAALWYLGWLQEELLAVLTAR